MNEVELPAYRLTVGTRVVLPAARCGREEHTLVDTCDVEGPFSDLELTFDDGCVRHPHYQSFYRTA